MQQTIERAHRYVEAGAEMIFAEAVSSLEDYQAFTKALSVPVLANLTEFGVTPFFTVSELEKVGVSLVFISFNCFSCDECCRTFRISAHSTRRHATPCLRIRLPQTRRKSFTNLLIIMPMNQH